MKGIYDFFTLHPWLQVLGKVALVALLTWAAAAASRRLWRRNAGNRQYLFRRFVYNIVQLSIYLFGVLLCIGQIPALSKLVQTILAGSGILALAISLSAQESLNNVISGLFITLFKPFEVGDRVTLVNSKITGNIEDITLRHTIIKTFTNTRIVIPNATINKEIVENSNLIDVRTSNFIDVDVAYESDIEKAMEIMADVIGNHPYFWDMRSEEEKETLPKVKVYVRAFASSGISLRASMWTRTVNENFEACSDARLRIKQAFDRAGIEIPYTKYTILYQEPREPEIEYVRREKKELVT